MNIRCPRNNCGYTTVDHDPSVAAALLTCHATSNQVGGGETRVPPVDKPRLQVALFKSRWQSFKAPTNVHQLLRSLDNDVITLVYNEQSSPEKLSGVNC